MAYKFSISHITLGFTVTLCLLAVINFLTIQGFKDEDKGHQARIRVAERNALLSQQIAYYAHQLYEGDIESKKTLKALIELHDNSLLSLKTGGIAPGWTDGTSLPSAHVSELPHLEATEKTWQDYKRHVNALLTEQPHITDNNGLQTANPQVRQALNNIKTIAPQMQLHSDRLTSNFTAASIGGESSQNNTLLLLLAVNIGAVIGGLVLAKRHISKPLDDLATATTTASEIKVSKNSDPSIQQIAQSINRLNHQIDESARFSKTIGKGDFSFEFDSEVGDSKLFAGLNSMKKKLQKVAIADQKRNWTTEGVAKFSELLRANQDNLQQLCDNITKETVKYLEANQGSLFLLNNTDYDEPMMELKGCYAYNRKKI